MNARSIAGFLYFASNLSQNIAIFCIKNQKNMQLPNNFVFIKHFYTRFYIVYNCKHIIIKRKKQKGDKCLRLMEQEELESAPLGL